MKQIRKLIELLINKKLTISTCESASGGYLSSLFTLENPGVSKCFKGGLITYCNEAKVVLASVKAESINNYSAISEQVVEEMALNTSKLLETDVAISISGNAGPSSSENQGVGVFYIGISILGITNSYKIILQPSFSRKKMIEKVVDHSIDLTIKSLL